MIPSRLVKYLLSGGAAFTVDYLVLLLLFYVIGTSLLLSTTLGFLSGLLVSFIANRYWVHGAEGSARNHIRQIIEYLILVLVNYTFTLYALNILYEWGIPLYVSKIVVIALITCWNYIIFKKIIFSSK